MSRCQTPSFLADPLSLSSCASVSLVCCFQICPINLSIIFSVSSLLDYDIQSLVVSFPVISHAASQLWPPLLQLLLNSDSLWMPCQSPLGELCFLYLSLKYPCNHPIPPGFPSVTLSFGVPMAPVKWDPCIWFDLLCFPDVISTQFLLGV